MKVDANELGSVLQAALQVARSATSIPILATVRLGARDGLLRVSATDLVTLYEGEVACVGSMEPICAGAKLLARAVASASGEIEIAADGGAVFVRASGMRFNLRATDAGDFPAQQGAHDGDLVARGDAARALIHAADRVSVVADEAAVLPGQTGVWIAAGAGGFSACAFDQHRYAQIARGVADARLVCVPVRAVRLAARLVDQADGEAEVRVGSSHVSFAFGATIVSARLIDAAFPAAGLKAVMPVRLDDAAVVDRDRFAEVVGIAQAIGSNAVALDGDASGGLAMTSVGRDDDEAGVEAEVALDSGRVGVRVCVQVRSIAEVLAILWRAVGDRIALSVTGELEPIRIDGAEGEFAVVMPMRI